MSLNPKFITAKEAAALIPDGDEFYSWAKLIHNGQVDGYLGSHLGTNREAQEMQNDGRLNVDLVPQGSLAEMIRAGGAGLGGVLTPTGVGTIVEESPLCLGKQTIEGRDYLLMKALKADIALVNAHYVDKAGNMWYKGTTRNFNTVAATAANIVICEADHLVEVGDIEPENVVTPGAYINYIVDGGKA